MRLRLFVLLLGLFVTAGLPARPASADGYSPPGADGPTLNPAASDSTSDYRLGPGDKLRVIVFGEDDLGGEFVVDGNGFVRLPLIGEVQAAGKGVHTLENDVANAFKSGDYLKDPRVNVEVLNYRPFYIIGEVNKPGEYPYVNDMNVLNAVALAGGYTFRADDSYVYIRHADSTKEVEVPADQTVKVQPGDIVRVTERFF